MLHFFGAAVVAAPTKIEDRKEYSTTINAIASIIMNWYGSLIVADDQLSGIIKNEIVFDRSKIGDQWLEYRSQYPQNITQILITHTQLFKLDNDYLFKVSSKVSFKNQKNKIQTQSLNESFIFANKFFSQISDASTSIKNIRLVNIEEVTPVDTSSYNRDHYKVREFIYAWLTYLDGLNSFTSVMNGDLWLEKASYSLEMGNNNFQGTIAEVLTKRTGTLATGGHLLRSLDVIQAQGTDNTFIVEIVLDWKGFNDDGKSVIAKIKQQLEIRIKEDNSWIVLSIKEKHLLPIVAPWVGLLC